jgi:hypothetical protein
LALHLSLVPVYPLLSLILYNLSKSDCKVSIQIIKATMAKLTNKTSYQNIEA